MAASEQTLRSYVSAIKRYTPYASTEDLWTIYNAIHATDEVRPIKWQEFDEFELGNRMEASTSRMKQIKRQARSYLPSLVRSKSKKHIGEVNDALIAMMHIKTLVAQSDGEYYDVYAYVARHSADIIGRLSDGQLETLGSMLTVRLTGGQL